MSAVAASAVDQADNRIISKGEFAARRNVSPGRVSQWISSGKISGAAIVGEGRAAKINEPVAIAQLKKSLDALQLSANGLSTRLGSENPAPSQVSSTPSSAPSMQRSDELSLGAALIDKADTVQDQIHRERLTALQRENRRKAEEDAIRAGTLVSADDVAKEMRKLIAATLNAVEGGFPEIATAFAAKWSLPQRDVLHLLRSEFRGLRARAAEAFRMSATSTPRMTETPIATDDEAAFSEAAE